MEYTYRGCSGMDDSVRQQSPELEVDVHNPWHCWVCGHPPERPSSLGARVCAGEEAGEKKWEEELLNTREFDTHSELPLILTPEMRPPLYSGHFKMSKSTPEMSPSNPHSSNQDTLTGPKGGRIRESPLYF